MFPDVVIDSMLFMPSIIARCMSSGPWPVMPALPAFAPLLVPEAEPAAPATDVPAVEDRAGVGELDGAVEAIGEDMVEEGFEPVALLSDVVVDGEELDDWLVLCAAAAPPSAIATQASATDVARRRNFLGSVDIYFSFQIAGNARDPVRTAVVRRAQAPYRGSDTDRSSFGVLG